MKKSFKKYEKAGLPGGPNELKRFTNGFIISERGQWDYPGQPTAVPTPSGKITMEGVEDDLLGIDNLGNTQYMTPGNEYQFEGDMVYEIPQAKRGGSKKPSKKFSRSLMAKNRLFAKNPLFKKKKSVKNKIFDPNSPYFQPGGEIEYNQLPKNYQDALKNFVAPEVINLPEETDTERYGYDAALGVIYQNPNDPIENMNNPWWGEHELFHHLQNQAGAMSTYGTVGQRPNPYVASDEAIGSYYDRRGAEFDIELNKIFEQNPDISEEEAYTIAEENLYRNPTSVEGEARNYEGYIEAGNPSMFPKKQQGGFMEVELDDNEIEEYRKGGYIVEDISVPSLTKASYGHSVGNLIRKQKGGEEIPDWAKNQSLVKKTDPNKDDTYENVFEIFDPSGLSSWDDVSRSYSKNGLNGETLLEVIGALPVIGKIGKATSRTIKAASRGLPLTTKQIRNINNTQKILKYSPKALKAYDAAQAYNEENNPVKKAVIKPEVTVRPKKQEGGSISGTQGLTDDFSQRLTKFILDARAQGVDLGVGSGYRSYEKQKRLWEQALKKYGSPEKARKWVAPPGGSFHNKGLAVDLNANGQFLGKDANSKATEWAHANAKKYGLHFRMGHEPWHIEPIEKTKSNSDKENEHDHEHDDEAGIFGDQPKPTTQEEYDKMIQDKNLEFELKQKELAERERRLHDDDYSNWKPAKTEVVDPRQQILDQYSKIIAPSSQNVFEQYTANLQGQMKDGGFIMELTEKEIDRYRKGGFIIEELD